MFIQTTFLAAALLQTPSPQPTPPQPTPNPAQAPSSPIDRSQQPTGTPGSPIQPTPQRPMSNSIQQGAAQPNQMFTATIRRVDLQRNRMIVSVASGAGERFYEYPVPRSATFHASNGQPLTGRFQSTQFTNPQALNVPVQLKFGANGQIADIRLLPPSGVPQSTTGPRPAAPQPNTGPQPQPPQPSGGPQPQPPAQSPAPGPSQQATPPTPPTPR